MRDQDLRFKAPEQSRRGSAEGPSVFHQAVSILVAKHGVTENAAYEMLVHAAVEAGTTVREVAKAVIVCEVGRAIIAGPPEGYQAK